MKGRFIYWLDFELGHQLVVRFVVRAFQVAHEAAAFADFFDKTTTGGEVLFVGLQVIGQFLHFFAQDRDLDLRRTGVGVMGLKFLNDLLFLLWV